MKRSTHDSSYAKQHEPRPNRNLPANDRPIRNRLQLSGVTTVSVVLVLTGCTLHNPLEEDYVSVNFKREIGTLANDAGNRLTVVRMRERQPRADGVLRKGEFCSEPPPDAMVAFAQSWAGKLENASGSEAEIAHTLASSMGPLLYRSQGLQWNRDNMAYLCTAHMNGRIDDDEYHALMWKVLNDSKAIILKEVANRPPITMNIGTVGAPAMTTPKPGE